MKQKKIKYLLVAGTLFIWSTIIYRLIDGINPEPAPTQVSSPSIVHSNNSAAIETYHLIADYRDPFFEVSDTTEIVSKQPITATNNFTNRNINPIPRSLSAEELLKKNMIYAGMIYNSEKKIKIGMVNLLGKDFLVKEKDVIEKFIIKKIETNTLTVTYGGKKITISRTN